MITKITGTVIGVTGDVLTLGVGPYERAVMIPEFARRQLQSRVGDDASLFTIEYFEGNAAGGRITPRMVGFLHGVEREFFEMFCEVDGVGVKKALRAMVRPVAELATLIEQQDVKGLSALPGIGPATAERIIAKLRRRAPKFALLVGRGLDSGGAPGSDSARDLAGEAFDVLRSLGHSEPEARRLVESALAKKKSYKDIEALLHAVYEQQQS
ncbi:Holliday junction ATP-dependent DNA helicase RuvA [Pirellulimonas nuda]|uniref:Holliday junction branch migration complex subunit RuvA n=1 Tax=Pirellulimonas nuda TaxID=2528009 RepID=A0A518D813_9BACT|nr:Holliday junction branch migration protein RuvA [Pirellulimonas nuda]QDU87626.1 Holliday junction ATP-dependent DNA helicase RuvA [Pirellulimonas nuda]